MKILHVITSLQSGGAERLMVDLLPLMKSRGVEVDLCVFNSGRTPFYDELSRRGIKIVSLSSRNVYHPINLIRLYKLVHSGKYDIVHTHNTACQLFGAVVSLFTGSVFFTTEHNTTNRRRGHLFLSYIDRWMYARYRRIICISRATETNLRKAIGDLSTKTSVIYNGIDVQKFSSAEAIDRCSVSDRPDRKVVSMVAVFRPQKDHETVIKAVEMLSDEYELWLVGDGECRVRIESLIAEHNVQDRVRLLGLRNDVPSILKASDIVVMSSFWEGFGLAAVEAMAAGKPVVASAVEGLDEVVDGAGQLFPCGDSEELVCILEKISNDRALYDDMIRKGLSRAEVFNISAMADNYLKVYRGYNA